MILQRYHVAKQTFKITNWATYNNALIHRGSLTFWLNESTIQPGITSPARLDVVVLNVILSSLFYRTDVQTCF